MQMNMICVSSIRRRLLPTPSRVATVGVASVSVLVLLSLFLFAEFLQSPPHELGSAPARAYEKLGAVSSYLHIDQFGDVHIFPEIREHDYWRTKYARILPVFQFGRFN